MPVTARKMPDRLHRAHPDIHQGAPTCACRTPSRSMTGAAVACFKSAELKLATSTVDTAERRAWIPIPVDHSSSTSYSSTEVLPAVQLGQSRRVNGFCAGNRAAPHPAAHTIVHEVQIAPAPAHQRVCAAAKGYVMSKRGAAALGALQIRHPPIKTPITGCSYTAMQPCPCDRRLGPDARWCLSVCV